MARSKTLDDLSYLNERDLDNLADVGITSIEKAAAAPERLLNHSDLPTHKMSRFKKDISNIKVSDKLKTEMQSVADSIEKPKQLPVSHLKGEIKRSKPKFSFIPGLPTTVNKDVWFMGGDYKTELNRYPIILKKHGSTFVLVKNATGREIVLKEHHRMKKRNANKKYVKLNNGRYLVKEIKLIDANNKESNNGEQLPEELINVILPRTHGRY